ncbi:MAG: D-alanyl-D-alanine carboxypeptidase/D-alanyl-D-alanine-endopeptidase [Pseudorhodobacter sp.]
MIEESRFTRRWVLAGLLSGIALPGCAEAPKRSIRPAANPGSADLLTARSARLVEAAGLKGEIAFVVADAKTGKILEARHGETALPPASVAKAMTALYGLNKLGAGYRFSTTALATGTVANGQLHGDLVLIGSGDPTLDTDRLGQLAAALAKHGIKGITGRFLVCATGIPRIPEIDRSQPTYVGYNPTISGLNLNFNRVHFEWKRSAQGYRLTMDARGKNFLPKVSMAEIRAVDRKTPIFDYRQGKGRDQWTVAAGALGKGGSRWLPVRQPELYCAEVFATLMRSHGLRLPTAEIVTSPPTGTVLARTQSEPLSTISRSMLRYSTNITAEAVGLAASGARSLKDSGRRMSDWAEASYGANARFVDHSGLGGDSRIAPMDMVRALRLGQASGLPALLRPQSMRDSAGNVLKNHPAKVVAKTGTLNFVSGLAGYIQPPSGKNLVFAIFCADISRRNGLSRAERERPQGGRAWTSRARRLQGQLLTLWAERFA